MPAELVPDIQALSEVWPHEANGKSLTEVLRTCSTASKYTTADKHIEVAGCQLQRLTGQAHDNKAAPPKGGAAFRRWWGVVG